MAELAGKTVVVTGAGSGIGRASAELFARLGARVHVADVNGPAAQAVADGIGAAAVAHTFDCTDPEAVEELAGRVFEHDRRVDVLHNNAGIGHAAGIEQTTIDDWQRVIGVNLLGAAYVLQAFVPRMLAQGGQASIVNTASMAGLVAAPQMAPYSASKFGVVGMSEALDVELRPRGIHVCALCPGIIDTAITRSAIMRGQTAERRDAIVAFYGKRGASPEQVAQAVLEAVRKRKAVAVVPRSQVMPPWLVKRVAPPASRLLSRLMTKLVMR